MIALPSALRHWQTARSFGLVLREDVMTAIVVEASIEPDECPFCGGRDLHIETDNEPGSSFQVVCDNPECEAEGPNGSTSADEAVSRWNRRAV